MKRLMRLFTVALFALPLVAMAQLISMDDLQKEIKSNKKLVVIGIDEAGGKIPGSRFVDYKTVRVKSNVPDAKTFEALVQKEGVSNDSKVVIVEQGKDTDSLAKATRLYWTFKYYGHDNVAILNGGLQEWTDMGGEVTDAKPADVKAGNFAAKAPNAAIYASVDDVKAAVGKQMIIDVRDLGAYIGVYQKKGTKQAGHIDGAKAAPLMLYTKTGTAVRSKAELEKLFADLKIDLNGENIVYCNSGSQASVGWYVIHEVLGKKAKVFDGSMNEWDGPVSVKLQN
ncbi:MAG: sulfurtransferase [Campylobacterales bacterium]